MVIVYPMLTSSNISQNSLPGIIKAIEKYILVYNLDDVLNEANGILRTVLATGTRLVIQAGAIYLVAKAGQLLKNSKEYDSSNLFFLEQPISLKTPTSPLPPNLQAQQSVADIGKNQGHGIKVDIPRRDSISLEPTWVQINSEISGTKLLGVKVVPYTVSRDADIMDMISYDVGLTGFFRAVESSKRSLKSLVFSLMRGLKIPFIKNRALTGNLDTDILVAGTKHGRNLFICMNSIELEQGDIFTKPEKVQKLHSLGWSSLIIADDVNKKATFCMKEFSGMCSTIPYGLLYSAVGKEHYEVYQNIDDVKHSSGPFFRLSSKRNKIFSNAIANERLERYSVRNEGIGKTALAVGAVAAGVGGIAAGTTALAARLKCKKYSGEAKKACMDHIYKSLAKK